MRFVGRGPDERFPWGREAAEPLVVILKAATLGALCVYAAVGGIVDLLNGGREVEVGWAIVYALVATAGSLAVGLRLRYGTRSTSPEGVGTDLVRAEAAEWLGDALLSLGVLVGFLAALLLTEEGRPDIAAYVDPAMVVLVSVAFLVVPFRLIIGGLREVLSMSPSRRSRRSCAPALTTCRGAIDCRSRSYAPRKWVAGWTSKSISWSGLIRRWPQSPIATPYGPICTSGLLHSGTSGP